MSADTIIERFVSIETITDRWDSCFPLFYRKPTQRELNEKCRNMKKEIKRAYTEWRDDIIFYKERTPNSDEYLQEINSIKKILHFIDEDMNPDRFFKEGSVDTTFCKTYLNRMKKKVLPDELNDMKCLFFVLQLLQSKMCEDCPETLSAEEDEELVDAVDEEEDEELLKVLAEFNIGVKSHNIKIDKYIIPDKYILVAIMQIYQDDNKAWAATVYQYSPKIISILPETKDLLADEKKGRENTICRRIYRGLEDIHYLSLDKLTLERLVEKRGILRDEADLIIGKYKKAYNAVLQCLKNVRNKRNDKNDMK